MDLTSGINHVAIVTHDLDRLTAFYTEVFGGSVVAVDATPFGRIGIVRLGPGIALNLFETADNEHQTESPVMFGRGHVDHFGINAIDDQSFWELHRRLVERGCATGDVNDFGPVIGFDFTDPDGMTCEVDLVLDPTLAGSHSPQRYAGTARLADQS
jgi:catechol 2,3-dioxygenase-like lactoylglutathione lyase family enzyme